MTSPTEAPVSASSPSAAGGRGWLLIRLTGVLLSVLVLGHLLAVHLLTDVAHTTSSFVLRRWSSTLWVAWDGTMLTAALAHGAAGTWTVLRDHIHPGRGRRVAAVVLAVVSLSLAGLGWYTIAAVVQTTLATR
jgi:succinate dehydrogenase hydrophobic anchor subunit